MEELAVKKKSSTRILKRGDERGQLLYYSLKKGNEEATFKQSKKHFSQFPIGIGLHTICQVNNCIICNNVFFSDAQCNKISQKTFQPNLSMKILWFKKYKLLLINFSSNWKFKLGTLYCVRFSYQFDDKFIIKPPNSHTIRVYSVTSAYQIIIT